MSNAKSYNSKEELTIRLAGPADAEALRRLAQLDSDTPPTGPAMLAEVDGVAVAALSTTDGRELADPFRPTAHIVQMLREHMRRPHPSSPAATRFASGLHGRSAPWPV